MQIPEWWLWVSAAFFIANMLFFLGLGYFLYRLAQLIKDVNPKIVALTERVDSIGKRVEEISTSLRTSVDSVGGRAKTVAGSASHIAQIASQQFERFSPFIVGALTSIRLIKALNEVRKGRSLKTATTQAALDTKDGVPKKALQEPQGRRKK